MALAAGPGADVGPDELADDGDGQHEQSDGEDARVGELAQVDAQPCGGEEHGREHTQGHLLEDVAHPIVEALHLSHQDPGDESPEDRLKAQGVSDRAERQGERHEGSDHDAVPADVVVERPDQEAYQPPSQRVRHDQD